MGTDKISAAKLTGINGKTTKGKYVLQSLLHSTFYPFYNNVTRGNRYYLTSELLLFCS